MKKTNKGFTIVELIIVIAVIGVLAAILIPTFANVIEKANRKSALSDAKNALQSYLAEATTGENGGDVVGDGTVFAVLKAKKFFFFQYENNGLNDNDLDPQAVEGVDTVGVWITPASDENDRPTENTTKTGAIKAAAVTAGLTIADGATVYAKELNAFAANFPTTVVMFYAAP